jgi:hypothetical protein
MANGATEYIRQVADLGPIIGFAGVLESATQTLIGLGPLMDKGFELHFFVLHFHRLVGLMNSGQKAIK